MRSAALSNIHVSGGLLSEHFIRLMREDTPSFVYAQPDTFITPSDDDEKPPKKGEYDRKVAQLWTDLKERWDIYGHKFTKLDPADARRLWVKPLLEALGFDLVPLRKSVELSDQLKLKFSHRGWDLHPRYQNPPIVHVVSPSQSIDARTERGKPSPHDAVQEYLNRHDDLWALVTNGLYLRVLRDYHHTYVKGYVEFDLEAIFITRSFRDFQALYRIAHASRFTSAETGNLYLEEYFQHSQLVGEKVGAKLRENVVRAVMALGNGFLNEQLLAELRADEVKCHEFYEEILRVVYRIIFILYAEQRGMLAGDVQAPNHDLYLEEYSMSALRERALTDYRAGDRHVDYWVGLRSTFEILRRGSSEFGIYPYGGLLFDTDRDNYVAQHACKNSGLLEAIYYLTTTEIDGTIHRISYADIDVEEVGAIYESLLENTPQITSAPESINSVDYPANSFILDPRALTRKTTGSYYTNHALIQELIKSALEPVIKDRSNNAGYTTKNRERALLSIKVCDPACGSGAFLIAACNRLALELARIRTGDTVLTDVDLQSARRDVLQHCIYGVDLNPMAIELVKVSLWINALVKDRPLNFLDHHLKCGNSIVGTTRELMAAGIPDEAFDPIDGDNKKIAESVKKLNKVQKQNASLSDWLDGSGRQSLCDAEFAALSEIPETTPYEVKKKNSEYWQLAKSDVCNEVKFLADLWTAAFFWTLTSPEEVPTQLVFNSVAKNGTVALETGVKKKVEALAKEYSFFHWQFEFPEVFGAKNLGFDCVLGNPPWDRLKTQRKEFFLHKAPEIVNARTASDRKKMIRNLVQSDPELSEQFRAAKRRSECERKFLRNSVRFPLTGKGVINTYSTFSEHARQIISSHGRAGIIVQTGIATDETTADFFADIVDKKSLISLFDFENRRRLFPIHSSFKFCLLSFGGYGARVENADLAFFLHDISDIGDTERHFELTREDIHLINPNTRTSPVFRNQRDAQIVKKIYRKVPVLLDERKNKNPWRVTIRRFFHLSDDSHLFKDANDLAAERFELDGSIFKRGNDEYLPLYEGKMIEIYNHRLTSAKIERIGDANNVRFDETSPDELRDPFFCVAPRFWIKKDLVVYNIASSRRFLIGYRIITNATNRRTAIFSIMPCAAVGNSIFLIFFNKVESLKLAMFLANVNSIVFDYVVRQKLGGTNLLQFIFKQLPVLPPTIYTDDLIDLIAPKILELCYTAWDVEGFAKDLGYVDAQSNKPLPPFKWDEARRLHLQAQLDAIYAHLYGVSRADLDYLLDTFPIVKREDVKKFGTYRIKELILNYYDEYAGEITAVEEQVPHD